jgi:RHH-type proline utilization regulon transcriptional repressor/proline dehydrogenase/delta 1-pyrroline-5-carboxylate dehydrogenase
VREAVAEADADVCEAIDFLEYYAREAIELEAGRRSSRPRRAQRDALPAARRLSP